MGILLLPARTGELLRPYLISQQKGVDVRSALATVVVERILDGLTIMGFFVWIIFFIPVPLWVHRARHYAVVNHLVMVLFTVALGVIFLPRVKISWPHLFKNKNQ